MDVKEQIALSILKGAGGDVDKDYTSTAEIYRDVESIYRAQDNRQDVESLQVELIDNGLYTYDDRNTQGYKPVEINVNVPVDDYYNSGFENGMEIQKSKLESITITENGNYTKEDGYDEVEVNIDTQSFYDNGYNNGYNDGDNNGYERGYGEGDNKGYERGYGEGVDVGIQEQKNKLESITIESNGTYIKEDGYKEVKVALDMPKPKIYNGFRFVSEGNNDYKRIKDIDFSQYDWSGVYELEKFFSGFKSTDGGGLVASDFDNFLENFDGEMLSCHRMFQESTALLEAPNFGDKTQNCADMSYLFFGCNKLTSVDYLNTTNATHLEYLFSGCNSLVNIPQIDTSKSSSLEHLFGGCTSLTHIDPLDTSSATNIRYMYYNCNLLESVPQFDTHNVQNMEYVFSECSSLTSIPQLDTSSATTILGIFNNCTSLESIPLLNCQNVTYINNIVGGSKNNTLTTLGGFKDLGKQLNVNGTSSGFLDLIPNLTHQSLVNVLENLYDRKANGMYSLTIKLGTDNLNKLTDEEKSLAVNKGYKLS